MPEAYDGFIMNFNMYSMDKTISELRGMLKTTKKNIKNSTKDVLMVNKGKGMKKVGKDKGKRKTTKGGYMLFLQWTRSLEKKLQTISG